MGSGITFFNKQQMLAFQFILIGKPASIEKRVIIEKWSFFLFKGSN